MIRSQQNKRRPSHPSVEGEWDSNSNPVISWDTVEEATNYKILKWLLGNSNYDTISVGNVLSFTDVSVDNGGNTGSWCYEMVAEDIPDGNDLAISNTVIFDSQTGDITYDDSGFQ